MKLTVSHDFLPKRRSLRAAAVMDHFGIGFETGRHVIADGLELPIRPGDLVCFTGASGSGKSSLLRAAAEALSVESGAPVENTGCFDATRNPPLIDIDDLVLPDRILVDAVDRPLEESLPILASCGLAEAHLLLRTPAELSDGQRYRFRLALAVSRRPEWILADEFTATLDRTLAKVVSFNVRRLCDRTGIGFLLATTHEDVLDDLAPSLHVRCRLDGEIDCGMRMGDCGMGEAGNDSPGPVQLGNAASKENTSCRDDARESNPQSPIANPQCTNPQSVSSTNSPSPPERNRTGRISLGGITAATGWESCGS